MPQTASDIIVTGARVFIGVVGSVLPAPSLAVDAAWPAGWRDVGFTLEPTKLMYKFDLLEIFVEQTMGAVRRRRVKEEAGIETVLAEHSAENLALALAATASTVANEARSRSASVMARSRATSRTRTASGKAKAATSRVVTAKVTRKSRRRTGL